MIFARGISDPLTSLVKKLDAATGQHKDQKLGSFVVFLSDEDSMAEKLIELAQKEKIERTILGLMESAGPPEYKVAKEADITVVLYTGAKVKANYAFKKGKLTADDITRIVGDLSKILPEK
jgi:hypothetical protein